MDKKDLSSSRIHFAELSLQKKKSKTSFKKTTRRRKSSEDIFSNIDNIDKKIEHCLQLVDDTFNDKTSYEEFSNPWALSPTEQEQDQAFMKYLEELDEPISECELTEWSNDNQFINEFLVRSEGGWSPENTLPYDEDLLRFTLGFSPRVKTNEELYPDSDQVFKRNRLAIQPASDKKTESNKESISAVTIKRELQPSIQEEQRRQFLEYEELPF